MKPEEMFEAVRNGSVTKEEFESWVDELQCNSYSAGSDEANYQNAMGS